MAMVANKIDKYPKQKTKKSHLKQVGLVDGPWVDVSSSEGKEGRVLRPNVRIAHWNQLANFRSATLDYASC